MNGIHSIYERLSISAFFQDCHQSLYFSVWLSYKFNAKLNILGFGFFDHFRISNGFGAGLNI
jgi:hypothetical protein